jgi:protein-tyrosine phosphatase
LEVEHPLPRAYWVSPGRVLAGEYPGSVYLEDARPKLRWLLENGVSALVDLTERGELEPYLKVLAEESDHLSAGPEHQRQPIEDMSSPTVEVMTDILDTIDAAVEADKVVYLHCMAGLGRTRVVVDCYLVRHGMSGEDALKEIARLRRDLPGRSSPLTEDQRNMVREWPR